MTHEFTIHGKVPSKSNGYRIISVAGHSSLAKTAALKAYEAQFHLQCPIRGIGIRSFFSLEVDVYYENNRPDLDNALKVILDCLQSEKAISNDRYCDEIHARKFVDRDDPRIVVRLTINS